MQKKMFFENKKTFDTLLLFTILFICKETAICQFNPETNHRNYKHLDIKNHKDNVYKIDLTANPTKNSNSFLEINPNELYLSNFHTNKGVKQFIHFHASVIFCLKLKNKLRKI